MPSAAKVAAAAFVIGLAGVTIAKCAAIKMSMKERYDHTAAVPFSPSQAICIVKKLKPVDDNSILSIEINGRHVILIGTVHDDEYTKFEIILTRYAVEGHLAYFAEGVIRDENAEKTYIAHLLDTTLKGYFFGLENPEIDPICSLSFSTLMMSNEKNQCERDNLCYKIFTSEQNRQLLQTLAEETDAPPLIKELNNFILIHKANEESQLLLEALPELPSYNDFSQWIELGKKLTLALLKKSTIDADLKDIITKALENPTDQKLLQEYIDKVTIKLRNIAFKDAISKTLSELPADVTPVVCMGNAHLPGTLIALARSNAVTKVNRF